MAATYTLSGNPKTLLGGDDFERIRAYITCDQPILTDPDTGEVRILGDADLILAGGTDTAFEVELPGNGWTPSPHFYTIHVEGRSRTTGTNRVVTTQPFQMTADITLADLPQAAPKAITVQDYENLYAAAEGAVAAAASAQEAAEQANAPTDGQVGTSLANRGLPTTGTEFSASIDGVVGTNGAFKIVRQTGDGLAGRIDWGNQGDKLYAIHLTNKTGAGSGGFAAALGIGNDAGSAVGLVVSQKTPGNVGVLLDGHGGAAAPLVINARSSAWAAYLALYKGSDGVHIAARTGQAFGNGVATQGSPVFTSATAAFTSADVGQVLRQTSASDTTDPSGTIPPGTTIVSVESTTSVTLSTNAAHTGTGIKFLVEGRAPEDDQNLLLLLDEQDRRVLEVHRGWTRSRRTFTSTVSDPATVPLVVLGAAAQTAEMFQVSRAGASAAALSILASGLTRIREGSRIDNSLVTANPAMDVINYATGNTTLRVQAASGQTSSQIAIVDSGGAVQSRFNKNGLFITKAALPADADVLNGELAIAFDSTPGATKVKFKARDSGGTLRTAEVALA